MQSYLHHRRLGAELRALHEQDKERFHHEHSHTLADRHELRTVLTSGHARDAARGDQTYLVAPDLEADRDVEKLAQPSSDSDTTQYDADAQPEFGPTFTGINPRDRTTKEGGKGTQVFVVGFGHDDPNNPKTWSRFRRIVCTLQVALIGFATLTSSAIDSAVTPQSGAALHVSPVVASTATGM